MAASPMLLLAISLSVLVFQGMIFGNELAEKSFPAFGAQDRSCNGDGLALIGCWIGQGFLFVFDVFRLVIGTVIFFFNLITFNVPGAPWFIRVVVGGVVGGGLVWSLTSLVRGN